MTLLVSIEKMEGRWIAYVDGLFGCFASHVDRDAALGQVPAALAGYKTWCARYGLAPVGPQPSEPPVVQEIIAGWPDPVSGEEVNAFFASDLAPLQAGEVETAARLLSWSHEDLFRVAKGVTKEALETAVDGAWNIGGILYHAARGDWWYLKALGLAPDWSEAPQEDFSALLGWTNEMMLAALPGLAGDTRLYYTGHELWTARKMLRRAVWHRRDHTGHVLQFRERLGV